jgi:hypothetical protein
MKSLLVSFLLSAMLVGCSSPDKGATVPASTPSESALSSKPTEPATPDAVGVARGHCGDGTKRACRVEETPCPMGLVHSIENMCWGACVDPTTCKPPVALVR